MAAHLRATFPGDGEEVTDVIARHYLDALEAVPGDPDTGQIREQAIAALIRAAERAGRTGSPARAAASYTAAAELRLAGPAGRAEPPADQPSAGVLWERAAEAAETNGDWARAIELAGRARDYHLAAGQPRAAARARAIAGRALSFWGRLAEAREQLTAAVEVLRADPDIDTVRALRDLAGAEAAAVSAEADGLSAEALTLGQALGVGDRELSELFAARGYYLNITNRRPEAAAYYRETARLADQAGDSRNLGMALLNLADIVVATDPGTAAETARAAAGHLRRAGYRAAVAVAIVNLSQALMMLGDWDTAGAELTQAADSDALADYELLTCHAAWLAALRGDAPAAQAALAGLTDLHASEDPQDMAMISVVQGFTAAARLQPQDALRHGRAALTHTDALMVSHDYPRWAWPLAARAAAELRDTASTGELLALLAASPPGHLPPMLRAERDLTLARLAAADHDPSASAAFAAAISSLRELSTPYHLAHGLLDQAQHLISLPDPDPDAAALAVDEARAIAGRLRCQPLLDRAADLTTAATSVPATEA